MRKLGSSRRGAWLATGVAMVLVVGSGAAFAAFPDTDVHTYTGCLSTGGTSSGQIGQVALGQNPLKRCSANQRLVHLSGGDITNVIAGDGLSGGGSNGAVTLSLDAGHSLPQDCDTGEVAKSDGSNAWDCADDEDTTYTNGTGLDLSSGNEFSIDPDYRVTNDQNCTTGQFASGIDGSGDLTCATPATGAQVFANVQSPDSVGIPSNSQEHQVVSLSVPAGAYSITAFGFATQDSDRTWVLTCRLYAGSTKLLETLQRGESLGDQSVAMMSLRNFSAATTLTVRCGTHIDGMAARHFGIQAVSVD